MTWVAILGFVKGVSLRTWLIVGGVVLIVIAVLTARKMWISKGAEMVKRAMQKEMDDAVERQEKDVNDLGGADDSALDDELRERRR